MNSQKFSFTEINFLLKLAIPLIITGLIESSVGFFSTYFLAHLGAKELAAGAVVSWIFFTLMVILWGTLCSVSILIAQKKGARDDKSISFILRDSLFLAVLFVIPATLLLLNIEPLLILARQDPSTIILAQAYMRGLIWAFLPDFVGIVLIQFLIGLGHIRTNMVFSLLWVPLNIFTNYGLIFGKFGFPALGIAGVGWGTTLAYWISTTLLILYLVFNKKYSHYFTGFFQIRPLRYFSELLHLGIPMGFMYCIEIAFFLMLTLIMGHLSADMLAANQIALQYLGQLSVVTFSIAQAVTVRMAHTLGARSIDLANRTAYIGVSLGFLFMVFVALCYWFIPYKLIGIDLNIHDIKNKEIIYYAESFLIISGIFQILEAPRIILFGALRGLKDTRFTLLTSIISFWVIAFPIGYYLAVFLHWGGAGLWWGLVLGTLVGVVLLFMRFKVKINHYYHVMNIKAVCGL